MANDLAEYSSRVAGLLQDSANQRFSTETIGGALRQALAEYGQAKGTTQTIQGLDAAAETTVPPGEAGVVILGAIAYGFLGRIGKRLEGFNAEKTLDQEMVAWGEKRLAEFKRRLEEVRRGTFRESDALPWPALGWAMDGWDANHDPD